MEKACCLPVFDSDLRFNSHLSYSLLNHQCVGWRFSCVMLQACMKQANMGSGYKSHVSSFLTPHSQVEKKKNPYGMIFHEKCKGLSVSLPFTSPKTRLTPNAHIAFTSGNRLPLAYSNIHVQRFSSLETTQSAFTTQSSFLYLSHTPTFMRSNLVQKFRI